MIPEEFLSPGVYLYEVEKFYLVLDSQVWSSKNRDMLE